MTTAVMILRVWVMYYRSRLILGTLLALLLIEVISLILVASICSDPKIVPGRLHALPTIDNCRTCLSPTAFTVRIQNVSYCKVGTSPVIWTYVTTISQITLGATMCILVIVQFMRQSLQMYSVNKQWQLNRYIKLLVREGILYFCG